MGPLFLAAAFAAIAASFAAAAIIVTLWVLIALTVLAHTVMAVIVWSRRPRTWVWMSKNWWGVLTLFFGLFAFASFFYLHYGRPAPRRCYRCGYAIGGLSACPECGSEWKLPADRT